MMSKEQLIRQLECIFCGSYEILEPKTYTKTVSKSRGHTHYTKTKSITTPVCSRCNEKIALHGTKDSWIIGLTILWVLIFFVALLCCDLIFLTNGLFWLMLPINIVGLTIFAILIMHSFANAFNMRSSVKFESGYNNNAVSIFSRKKGKWISYNEWMNQVVETRMTNENRTQQLFPNKKSIIWKLQFLGSIICMLSLLAPNLINLSENAFTITWLSNFFITNTPPGNFPFLGTFNNIAAIPWDSPFNNSSITSVILGNYALLGLIGAIAFFSLRNTTYLKKIEGSIKMNQIMALLLGFCAIFAAVIAFILPMVFDTAISFSISSYNSSNPLLNIQFYMIILGAAMIIIGFFISSNKNFKIEVEFSEELVDDFSDNTKSQLNQYQNVGYDEGYASSNSEGHKFCHNCGFKLQMNDEFCRDCGTIQILMKNN